ncbi:MAG TPA: DUF4160 domain-containing protein [Thermoanaerobaculia bacterium]|nr:DUF4160 domain-containing protein [Thermoanaerobaculia bacterium]
MPTIRIAGYKVQFYSSDGPERPHVHVFRGGDEAKVWLRPVVVAWSYGYGAAELNRIVKLVRWHQSELLEAWDAYFDGSR